jgi:hypothetical protein
LRGAIPDGGKTTADTVWLGRSVVRFFLDMNLLLLERNKCSYLTHCPTAYKCLGISIT